MQRFLLFIAALVLVAGIAAPAQAACTDITIGADISVIGYYNNDYDYDSDSSDSVAAWTEYVNIELVNTYTDKVATYIRLDIGGDDSYAVQDATKKSVMLYAAYITMEEFLSEGLTFMVGKLDINWQLRPVFGAGTFDALSPNYVDSSFVFIGQPVGLCFSYDFNENSTFTFAIGKCYEGSVEGNNDNDLTVYALRYDQTINEMNKFFVALIYYVDAAEMLQGDVWYFNAGIDYFVMEENLELYFEFAYQDGDTHSDSYEFGAFAFNFGAEYTFDDVNTIPYIGLDVTFISGSEDDTLAYQRVNTNWTRTLIVENDAFGSTIISGGYVGVKLVGGMKSIYDDKIAIDFVLGFFKADGDISDKGIGFEIDVLVSYAYTEDVTFVAGLGYFIPDEDLAGDDADAVVMLLLAINIIF